MSLKSTRKPDYIFNPYSKTEHSSTFDELFYQVSSILPKELYDHLRAWEKAKLIRIKKDVIDNKTKNFSYQKGQIFLAIPEEDLYIIYDPQRKWMAGLQKKYCSLIKN